MIPETESDSDTSAERSASRRWRSVVILRRTWPTRRVSHTNGGTNTSENAASRQSRRTMATIAAITVVAFWAIEVAVVVTTLSIPPMSLAIRDCTSPVRVRVKNASDIRCRWPVDRGAQIVHHALADHVGDIRLPTLMAAVAIAIPIMPSTSSVSSVPSR